MVTGCKTVTNKGHCPTKVVNGNKINCSFVLEPVKEAGKSNTAIGRNNRRCLLNWFSKEYNQFLKLLTLAV
jgi:hypothetical protein